MPSSPQSSALQAPIVLIGFMGSGKSSVARRLAFRLGCEYVDLDNRIEVAAGQSIADIFSERGEAAFRLLETQELRDALQSPTVISPGGGTVTQPVNREILRSAIAQGAAVIYLRAQPHTLADRIRRQPGKRPLIDGGKTLDMDATRRRVEELLEQRREHYESMATITIDTDGATLDDVSSEIEALLQRRTESIREAGE